MNPYRRGAIDALLTQLENASQIDEGSVVLNPHEALVTVLDAGAFVAAIGRAELALERRVECTAFHQFCKLSVLPEHI